jgi:hypothetical protein
MRQPTRLKERARSRDQGIRSPTRGYVERCHRETCYVTTVSCIRAHFPPQTTFVVSPGFIGILGMIARVVVLCHPFETVTVLATILGAVWIVTGVIEVIDAIANKYVDGRGWLALAGLVSIAAGGVIVAWPARCRRVDRRVLLDRLRSLHLRERLRHAEPDEGLIESKA